MNNTICKFPWSSVTSTMVNTFRPCCRFPFDENNKYPTTEQVLTQGQKAFNNPFMIQLRKDMLDGVSRAECQKCYVEERSGIVSMRQKGNAALHTNFTNLEFEHLEFLEVSLDNLCNLECKMCESTFSTRLYSRDKLLQEQNIQGFNPVKLQYKTLELMDSLDLGHLRMIKMLGGEPLISPNLLKFLEKIPTPNNVDLFIVTNATTIPDSIVLEKFKQFKSVRFMFSIDGIYKFNDYQRVGSNFETTISNASTLGNLFSQNHNIHSTYSVLNIVGVEESTNWFNKNISFEKSIDIVANNILSPYYAPNKYIEQVLDSISKTNPYKSYIENSFNQHHAYDETKWLELLKFVKITDNLYGTKILDVNPFIANEVSSKLPF